jgi:hypothetical protein
VRRLRHASTLYLAGFVSRSNATRQTIPICGNKYLIPESPRRNMPDSKYKIIKDGWGNRPNFQASHGLGMTPEDLEEGEAILDELQKASATQAQGKSSPSAPPAPPAPHES